MAEINVDSIPSAGEGTQMEVESPGHGQDITPEKDGGVLKEIKREGVGDSKPLAGDEVFVHYVGTLLSGEKFDSSRDRKEQFQFTLGKGKVIRAWDLGVATMRRGELAVLTCKPEYAYGETGAGDKIPPNSTLVFEVELFDWKGEDITLDKDGGVLRSKLTEGEGFQTPNESAQCSIHVRGSYEGRVFEDRDVEFVYGEAAEAGIVEGVELAVKQMNMGEVARLVVKSQYAYGSKGNEECNIPLGATLEYDVTLKSFEKAKESWEMDFSEKLEQADIFKTKGTNYFKKGSFGLASKFYEKAVELLKDENPADKEEAVSLRERRSALLLAAHLNAAMCCLKLADNIKAREHCDSVLDIDQRNEKALFRRGTAKMNMQEYDEAITDFKAVLEVAPGNKAAKNQIALVGQKIRAIKEKEKKTFAGMFEKFAEIDSKKNYRPDEYAGVMGTIDDWDNKMAEGYLPLDKEAEAFGEKMPEPKYNKISKDNSAAAEEQSDDDD